MSWNGTSATQAATPDGAPATSGLVHARHRLGRLAVGEAGEDVRLDELHADEVERRTGRATRHEPDDPTVLDDDAAVLVRPRVGHEGHRHARARAEVRRVHRREIQRVQGVAVDDPEPRGVDERQRVARAARRAEQRLLPRVADAHAEIATVTDDGGDRLWPVVQVDDRVTDPLAGEPGERPAHERLAGDGQRGLRAQRREDAEPRAAPGRQHERPIGEGQRQNSGRGTSSRRTPLHAPSRGPLSPAPGAWRAR